MRRIRGPVSPRARAGGELARRRSGRGEDHAGEVARCTADPAYFADAYGEIDDTQGHGDGSGTMPFKLWAAQRTLMGDLVGNRLVAILKARQLGITWLVCAFALWLCLFRPGQLVLLFSKGQDEADEMLRRVKVLYDRLPGWLRASLAPVSKDTTRQLAWKNGSRIKSMPATRGAGRSLTASLIVLDEAAWMLWAQQLITAAKPTIDGGGRMVVLSTANGLGGAFHRTWVKAVAGTNRFKPCFLPWWERPGRDAEWFARVQAEAVDPALVPQEYPANAVEAFVASGRLRFPSKWIEALAKGVLETGIAVARWPESLREFEGDGLVLYGTPAELRKKRLILSADVAEGKDVGEAESIEGRGGLAQPRGDFSCGVLVDRDTGEEWGTLHGRWEPDEFARRLWLLSGEFSAPILVERNNHGHAVLVGLKHRGYDRALRGHDDHLGWATTSATKPVAIDGLAARLRDGRMVVKSQAHLDEFQVYRVNEDGSTGAPPGYHDDRVMAWANLFGYLQLCGDEYLEID